VFFVGFVLLNLSVLLMPLLFAVGEPVRGGHLAAVAGNAVVFAAGVFANLAFEDLGLDLFVVAIVALAATLVWWRRRRDAVAVYYLLAYWLGLGGTLAYQALA
jgi:membrane protein implicated in regulation of membrane protease activity